MKNYRTAIAALVLALAFSTSASADEGILWTDKTPPPPPPPQAEGVLLPDEATSTSEEDSMTEIALSLLQTLIPLL